jgi:hypothetical protein
MHWLWRQQSFGDRLPEVLREHILRIPIGASNTWAWTGCKDAWIILGWKNDSIESAEGGILVAGCSLMPMIWADLAH